MQLADTIETLTAFALIGLSAGALAGDGPIDADPKEVTCAMNPYSKPIPQPHDDCRAGKRFADVFADKSDAVRFAGTYCNFDKTIVLTPAEGNYLLACVMTNPNTD
jgi:hypothetical protein